MPMSITKNAVDIVMTAYTEQRLAYESSDVTSRMLQMNQCAMIAARKGARLNDDDLMNAVALLLQTGLFDHA